MSEATPPPSISMISGATATIRSSESMLFIVDEKSERTPIGSADDSEILVRILWLGRAKVDELQVAIVIQQDVASLDVTVDDILRMQISVWGVREGRAEAETTEDGL